MPLCDSCGRVRRDEDLAICQNCNMAYCGLESCTAICNCIASPELMKFYREGVVVRLVVFNYSTLDPAIQQEKISHLEPVKTTPPSKSWAKHLFLMATCIFHERLLPDLAHAAHKFSELRQAAHQILRLFS